MEESTRTTLTIACVSDLHGHLPAIPDVDLLLIAGDIVPTSAHRPREASRWLRDALAPWLRELAGRGVATVAVAGNHDFIFQDAPELVPAGLAWDYLLDSGVERLGLRIWGSPWQPRFHDWAFNLDEPGLRQRWAMIPDDVDVVLLHGPPAGAGDSSPYDNRPLGSPSLRERIEAVAPALVVCGHIHGGRGLYAIGPTRVVNAAITDDRYRPIHGPTILELPICPTPRSTPCAGSCASAKSWGRDCTGATNTAGS